MFVKNLETGRFWNIKKYLHYLKFQTPRAWGLRCPESEPHPELELWSEALIVSILTYSSNDNKVNNQNMIF